MTCLTPTPAVAHKTPSELVCTSVVYLFLFRRTFLDAKPVTVSVHSIHIYFHTVKNKALYRMRSHLGNLNQANG